MPTLLYTATIYPISNAIIQAFENMFFEFIWPNKKHHVKKQVLCKTIEEGGLNMPEKDSMIKALQYAWIKKMMLNDSPFLKYVENITNLKELHFLIRCKYDTKYMPETVPLFINRY